jgi:hypothetical protein
MVVMSDPFDPFDEFSEPQETAKPRGKTTLEQFEEANPILAAWWTGSTFDFAISLREFVQRMGYLTGPQMAAGMKCAEKFLAVRAERKISELNAPAIDIHHIVDAFNRAKEGFLRPKMRLLNGEDVFVFSLAPDTGRNAGAIYVVGEEDVYLGKIQDGKFYRSRNCSDHDEKSVLEACEHPEQSAVAYGQKFGTCSCCGKTLTNALSISLGIGPICRSNFFGS